jgi:hypothetical protein
MVVLIDGVAIAVVVVVVVVVVAAAAVVVVVVVVVFVVGRAELDVAVETLPSLSLEQEVGVRGFFID